MLLLRGATSWSNSPCSLYPFQYMLLLRGATKKSICQHPPFHVSIHAPLARSNNRSSRFFGKTRVSIHAPLARSNGGGRDYRHDRSVSIHAPLARSNPLPHAPPETPETVSIHAPLARSNKNLRNARITELCFNTCTSCEEQLMRLICTMLRICFNTCSSCEEQLLVSQVRNLPTKFQYMLLLRGATAVVSAVRPMSVVSIHAPLARSNLNSKYGV